jgi:hypothetical protein
MSLGNVLLPFSRLLLLACWLSLLFDFEDGGNIFLEKTKNFCLTTQHYVTGDGILHVRDLLRYIMGAVHNKNGVQLYVYNLFTVTT